MPQTSASSLLRLLLSTARPRRHVPQTGPHDVDRVAADQAAARDQVETVLVLLSHRDRAAVLSAVRHELRLALGSDAVPPGALHLTRADDSSIAVGSHSRTGTCFRAELVVVDRPAGSLACYAVQAWHERNGKICGLQQLQHVRRAVLDAVRSIDAEAQAIGPRARSDE